MKRRIRAKRKKKKKMFSEINYRRTGMWEKAQEME